jgi:tetratricopeptide (TPR) repeat protein
MTKRRFAIKRGAFNLEKEALLASGIIEKSRLDAYADKIDHLQRQFVHEIKPTSDPVTRARALFTWLWIEKPNRYKSHGNFRLNDVIDAHLNKDSQSVGNCLGLTMLFNCLLRRMGIEAEALYLENAFGIGPHVLTLLQTKDFSIDIENILPDGFDYQGHLSNPSRMRWGDRELVADIYHSLGNEYFEKGEWTEALKNYETSIHLNPHHEKTHLDKTILLDKMGRAGSQTKNSSEENLHL